MGAVIATSSSSRQAKRQVIHLYYILRVLTVHQQFQDPAQDSIRALIGRENKPSAPVPSHPPQIKSKHSTDNKILTKGRVIVDDLLCGANISTTPDGGSTRRKIWPANRGPRCGRRMTPYGDAWTSFGWICDTVRSRGGRCAYAIVTKEVVYTLTPNEKI